MTTAAPMSPPSPPRTPSSGRATSWWTTRSTKTGTTVELPRVGMNLVLPAGFDQMTWFGRGPFENYWDRKTAAFVGRYAAVRRVAVRARTCVRRRTATRPTCAGWRSPSADAGPARGRRADAGGRGASQRPGGLRDAGRGVRGPRPDAQPAHQRHRAARHSPGSRSTCTRWASAGDDSWGARTHDAYRLTGIELLLVVPAAGVRSAGARTRGCWRGKRLRGSEGEGSGQPPASSSPRGPASSRAPSRSPVVNGPDGVRRSRPRATDQEPQHEHHLPTSAGRANAL